MTNLFVDCDDTLVLWPEKPTGTLALYRGDAYIPNNDLIDAVNAYVRPGDTLFVWSGGGVDYAAMWANKFFEPGAWVALAKDITVPKVGDVVVDDQVLALKRGVRAYTWAEFVLEQVPSGP